MYGINMLPVFRVFNQTKNMINEIHFYLDNTLVKESVLRKIKHNESKQISIVNNILPVDATYELSMSIDGGNKINILNNFRSNTLGTFVIDIVKLSDDDLSINVNIE